MKIGIAFGAVAVAALIICFAPLVSNFDYTAYSQGERVYGEVLDMNFEEEIRQWTESHEFLIDGVVTEQVTNVTVTCYTSQVTLHNTDNISGDFEAEMIFYYQNSIVHQGRGGVGLKPNEVGTIRVGSDEPFDSWQLKVFSITPDGIWKHPEKTYYAKETLLERMQTKGEHCQPDDSLIYQTSGIYP